jgi:regulator of extracellular matrix RemA (YlzA/DUF370 family)
LVAVVAVEPARERSSTSMLSEPPEREGETGAAADRVAGAVSMPQSASVTRAVETRAKGPMVNAVYGDDSTTGVELTGRGLTPVAAVAPDTSPEESAEREGEADSFGGKCKVGNSA